jgi:hypothetical protein
MISVGDASHRAAKAARGVLSLRREPQDNDRTAASVRRTRKGRSELGLSESRGRWSG